MELLKIYVKQKDDGYNDMTLLCRRQYLLHCCFVLQFLPFWFELLTSASMNFYVIGLFMESEKIELDEGIQVALFLLNEGFQESSRVNGEADGLHKGGAS